jgi:general stress protein 26
MKKSPQLNPGMDKVASLIDSIGAGMLTTPDLQGVLTSRPMMPLEIDATGSIWFFTRPSGQKEADGGHLNLSFAKPADATYVSITGSSTLVYDRARIDELWSPMAKPWFPEGKDDPHLALLRVDVDSAEYWDSNSSRMVRLWAMATSAVSGKQAELGENAVVTNTPSAPVVRKDA